VARRVDNPPNPWASAHVEWLAPGLSDPGLVHLGGYVRRLALAVFGCRSCLGVGLLPAARSCASVT